MRVPYNKLFTTGKEIDNIRDAIAHSHLSGDGPFTRRCHEILEKRIGCRRALLTHSCTAGLELAALLADIEPGDEVIMPSFTFVSTANAFVLRGGVPVFVDIEPETLMIDVDRIEGAITPRTRAIVPVHYAGVACRMDEILALAAKHSLLVIEDAAQGISSTYRGRPLGSMGHLAALSFHETKNVISGEGGALLINDERFAERAEVIREKGTDRARFFRGQVDKYTWMDLGSSFLPSELTAAFLSAQLDATDDILAKRMRVWNHYHATLEGLERRERIRRPIVPSYAQINGHIYYVLVRDLAERTRVLRDLNAAEVNAMFHYVPLHSSSAGRRFGRSSGDLPVTESISDRLIRLPIWADMPDTHIEYVVERLEHSLQTR
ncbi:MAG: dTDP-4-amino-4,6-dideoxygalactose transaminase [Thermoanaerobaculia bacterium]